MRGDGERRNLHLTGIQIFISCGLLVLVLGGCKTRSKPSELNEIWFSLLNDRWKSVQEVSDRNEYLRNFEQLPTSGTRSPSPWASPLYPDVEEGVASRGSDALSPIEKFDLLLDHGNGELLAEEKARIGSDLSPEKRDKSRNLSQDWAAASILFAEPLPVKGQSAGGRTLSFSSNDIKALLNRFVRRHSKADEGVETRSLGGVCHLDSDTLRRTLESRTLTPEAWKDLRADDCFVVNPGAFHLALANFIGLRQESFVIDPQKDESFDSYPIQSFKSESLGTAVATEDNHSELQIKTTLTYVLPTLATVKTKPTKPLTQTVIYRYRIEMDEAGDIVGGSWLEGAAPQTIWMQNRPKFTAEDEPLEKLYTKSVSLPARMAMHDFSSIDTEELQTPMRDADALAINKKYRLELTGDAPRGADGLRNFLKAALRPLGPTSIFRNTFADEDIKMSIEVQFHKQTSVRSIKQALASHSNGRVELQRILR